jgi:hypothetical protein
MVESLPSGVNKRVGSKAEVMHGTALKTSGGLRKGDLMYNKRGAIVSRKKHAAGKKSLKRLQSLGYVAKKGQFTLFKKGAATRKNTAARKRTMRSRK